VDRDAWLRRALDRSVRPTHRREHLAGGMTSRVADDAARPLRVQFITEDDPLYVIRFFDVFLAEYPRDEFDVIGITIA
jgi:hypothetical protein